MVAREGANLSPNGKEFHLPTIIFKIAMFKFSRACKIWLLMKVIDMSKPARVSMGIKIQKQSPVQNYNSHLELCTGMLHKKDSISFQVTAY